MYGYFRCPDCNHHWESAHVYRKSGLTYYKQKCQNCNIYCAPYRVEPTVCSICGKQSRFCTCTNKKSDPNKPHRSELCEKCRSGRPCKYY